MNHGLGGKIGWVALPSYVEYPTSDKRNRNPNWTDSEIIRFLTILMEDPVLNDLNAQRNKQVFCYVSRKMAGEGSEKTWDQCRVKLKNLKSQWRYVKDRIPGIETADLDDEDVVRQLSQECQTRGVSPSCIKHLRLLKQFLISLAAVRKGVTPPTFTASLSVDTETLSQRLLRQQQGQQSDDTAQRMKMEEEEDEDTFDASDARLVVEAGISPPVSPGGEEQEEEEDHIVVEGENPLQVGEPSDNLSPILRVKSPHDINYHTSRKRFLDTSSHQDIGAPGKKLIKRKEDGEDSTSTAQIIQKFQREMTDKFLQFQRESEVRFLSWEQERWRLEQNLTERWRSERRAHEKEMFGMFCGLLGDCATAILDRATNN